MTENKNILVSSAGKRVSLVRSFQKELSQSVAGARVFCADANPELSAACRFSGDWFPVPKVKEPSFVETLLEGCIAHEIGLVIPTIDTELLVLARHRERFRDHGVEIAISDQKFIEICRDKRKIHDFFISREFAVPQMYERDKLEFPLFIKPYDGSRSVDSHLVSTAEELNDYHLSNDKFIYLQAIDTAKFFEVTIDLYYDRSHALRCVVPRRRLEVRDGEVNKGITVDEGLISYIRDRLAHLPGVRGCVNLQVFKEDKGSEIVGIEINPRFGGGFPLTYGAGGKFPKWLIQEYLLDKKVEGFFDDWELGLTMLRYDEEVFVSAKAAHDSESH